VPAGAEVSGSVHLDGGRLEALAAAGGGTPRSSGAVSGEITFSGRGTSPRNVVSALRGTGSLQFKDAKLAALWPGAIGLAVEGALKAESDKLAVTLQQALLSGLSTGQLPLPDGVALEIADGRLRTKPLTIDTAEGRAAGSASLDLRALMFESDWRLEQNPATGTMPDKPALPAVSVSYRGPAASLPALEPRIATEALERELAVRKMERDVEELERLRKLDETRRRNEAERLRRQFDATPPAPVPANPEARPATPG
jgi:hypothetical protein